MLFYLTYDVLNRYKLPLAAKLPLLALALLLGPAAVVEPGVLCCERQCLEIALGVLMHFLQLHPWSALISRLKTLRPIQVQVCVKSNVLVRHLRNLLAPPSRALERKEKKKRQAKKTKLRKQQRRPSKSESGTRHTAGGKNRNVNTFEECVELFILKQLETSSSRQELYEAARRQFWYPYQKTTFERILSTVTSETKDGRIVKSLLY